jgi:glutamate-1-semialdehyde 2,1-aminomutase
LLDKASPPSLRQRAHRAIPAGCHTYSKGDDQFPANAPGFIDSGSGCRVSDPDGHGYLDWGMGLRSVILGHAYPRVNAAAHAQIERGTNFTRPSPLEAELAETLIELIPAAEMVKFAKNGSDVTTAAVRLARASTGRDLIAFPREHPFYSFDDWFIGTTAIDGGVPNATKELSLTFAYGDLADLERIFEEHPQRVAGVIMEAATDAHPPAGYLEGVRALTERHGALLIFDEMITGFRWSLRGAQHRYGVTPDLATFGKAIGNGFALSALVGRRDVMELGARERSPAPVFLLSATHGGETHALAAAAATIAELAEQDVAEHLWRIGAALQDGLNTAAAEHGVAGAVRCRGLACSPILAFDDPALRTLFLQETVDRGILIPYIAPSFSHGDAEVRETVAAAGAAFAQVRRVLDGEPLEHLLQGPVIEPVFRRIHAVDVDA